MMNELIFILVWSILGYSYLGLPNIFKWIFCIVSTCFFWFIVILNLFGLLWFFKEYVSSSFVFVTYYSLFKSFFCFF